MIEACANGDLDRLQLLFNEIGFEPGDECIETRNVESESLPTFFMVRTAIENRNASILSLLLNMFPSFSVNEENLLQAAVDYPDIEVFKLLHCRYPNITNHEGPRENCGMLLAACSSGNPLLPEYLLDHGANPEVGGIAGQGPLYTAVIRDLPSSLIQKMVQCGGVVRLVVLSAAIEHQRIDVLPFLLERWHLRPQTLRGSFSCIIEDANKVGNKSITQLVEQFSHEERASGSKVHSTNWWRSPFYRLKRRFGGDNPTA